ncbi:MAG: LLM class flavin-dependent oxidoreductase [Candidatus Heimdallarchaeota archaeon]|nr:LLM class flavin-dependent oxidoreductase [Candidatus Heimdallarchaeota archaeon]MCK4877292.1 LLM class flavin-dependent oxidoreductase [Candidatus Heimdallarchaeota archaeon]
MTKSKFVTQDQSLRFGVATVQNDTWESILERSLLIERLGFDSIWFPDHFLHWNKRMMPFFEVWSILAALATQTSKIRIGTLVTNMNWRHPAWFAKQVLTVDHLSRGRLELGLGSGGASVFEYSMTGIKKLEPSERVRRFREYIEIIDHLLRNPSTTYNGEYFQLEEAIMQPEPVQKPRPPLTIGAHRPLMLKIAAQYADTWNTLGDLISNDESMEAIRKRHSLLDKYCKEINRDTQTLKRSFLLYETKAIHNFSEMVLYESKERIRDLVERCFDLGFTEIIIPYPLVEEEVPVFEEIANDVIPELREKYS